MENNIRIKNTGLRGVPVADTKISFIDGNQGILLYRGFRIGDLAEKSTFTEVLHLLLNGSMPNRDQFERFAKELAASRSIPAFLYEVFKLLPREADPMDILMASVPLLALADPELEVETREADVRKALRIMARLPGVLAAWHRIRNNRSPLLPDETLSHAADFLRRFNGEEAQEALVRALDVSMILQAEHTFNASSFACREAASTKAHMYAAVAAGVAALSGSLHGGANAKVAEMLFEVASKMGSRNDIARWVRERLDRKEKIMGMGHAVYKTFDPRSIILKQITKELSARSGAERLFETLLNIEETCHEEFERRGRSGIKSNVDFWTGLLYSMMGIPVDFMTPMFAISIAAGWCAHIIEEKYAEAQEKPALYRPSADYVGDYCGEIGCVYKPIDAR